jgi:hypothetical protein
MRNRWIYLLALCSCIFGVMSSAKAQNAPPAVTWEWCVRTVIELSPAACNRPGPEGTQPPIRSAGAARRELEIQSQALVDTRRMTATKRASELATLSLSTPHFSADGGGPWRLRTDNPDTYIWVIVWKK